MRKLPQSTCTFFEQAKLAEGQTVAEIAKASKLSLASTYRALKKCVDFDLIEVKLDSVGVARVHVLASARNFNLDVVRLVSEKELVEFQNQAKKDFFEKHPDGCRVDGLGTVSIKIKRRPGPESTW